MELWGECPSPWRSKQGLGDMAAGGAGASPDTFISPPGLWRCLHLSVCWLSSACRPTLNLPALGGFQSPPPRPPHSIASPGPRLSLAHPSLLLNPATPALLLLEAWPQLLLTHSLDGQASPLQVSAVP